MSGIDIPNTSKNSEDVRDKSVAEKVVALEGTIVQQQEKILDLESKVEGKQDRSVQMGGGIPRRDVSLTPTKTTKGDIGNPDTVKQRLSEKRHKQFGARQQGIENNKKTSES